MVLVALTSRVLTGGAARLARAAASTATQAVTLGKALRHRAEVRQLAELDDRLLKDLGLSRAQVMGALGAPLGVDPSLRLAEGRRGDAEVAKLTRAAVRRHVPLTRPAPRGAGFAAGS